MFVVSLKNFLIVGFPNKNHSIAEGEADEYRNQTLVYRYKEWKEIVDGNDHSNKQVQNLKPKGVERTPEDKNISRSL